MESTVPTVQMEEIEAQGGHGVCLMSQHTTATGRTEPLHFLVWTL